MIINHHDATTPAPLPGRPVGLDLFDSKRVGTYTNMTGGAWLARRHVGNHIEIIEK